MLHISPGFSAIFHEVKRKEKLHILDLGPLSPSCFEFFSSLSCKIYFENFNDFVRESSALSKEELVKGVEDYLLSHDSNEYFDLVLCWDLLNYLPLEAISILLSRICKYCKPHSLVHSIYYLGPKTPCVPASFVLKDERRIEVKIDSLVKRPYRQYSTEEFLEQNPLFSFCNRVENRKGMLRGVGEDILRCIPTRRASKLDAVVEEGGANQASPAALNFRKSFPSFSVDHNPKYLSPVMKQVLSEFGEKGLSLLDLGERNPVNNQLLGRYFSKIRGVSLYSSMRWRKSIDNLEQGSLDAFSSQALNLGNSKFDVVLLWDILNYFSIEQVKGILQRLNMHFQPGAKVVLFNYSGTRIPEKPINFYLTAEGDLHIPAVDKKPRPHRALNSSEIIRLSECWAVKNSYSFREGMKSGITEILFEYLP